MKTDFWLSAAHIVGVLLWVGGLTAVLALLHAHAQVEAGAARDALSRLERKIALVMDLGAMVAIGVGLYMALKHTPTEFKRGPWLHIKLTVVVLGVLSTHGLARVKIKKFSRGEVKPLPPIVWGMFAAGVITAAVLGANQLLLRG